MSAEELQTDMPPVDNRQARQMTRQQSITEFVMMEGSVRIDDLVERFDISLMTVHRDLDELVTRGLLRKSRGIASAAPTSLIEASDVYRSSRQLPEKKAIAQLAMNYVEPGHAIFLDDSTTVLQMAGLLPNKVPLTVITNSLTLMNEIRDVSDLTLLALGGRHYRWCNAFMGRMTTSEISRLRADTLFLSMAAITDDVVFHQSSEMIETKKAMFESSSRRILLVDHTRFERRALYGFAALTDFDVVIVDDQTCAADLERLRDTGVNVEVASMDAVNS